MIDTCATRRLQKVQHWLVSICIGCMGGLSIIVFSAPNEKKVLGLYMGICAAST
jgi:hypothetical protein